VSFGPAARDLVIGLADDELLTGHVLTSVAGWGPELEINIALSSMGQDEIGHARRLYGLVAGERETEELVYERPGGDFRAGLLARTYPAEWELLLPRQFLYETGCAARAAALAETGVAALAELVAEMDHEEQYHLDFWRTWLRTTTNRSAEARQRVQRGLDQMWPLASRSFRSPDPVAAAEAELGLATGALIQAGTAWAAEVSRACGDLGLSLRDNDPDPQLDRLDDMLGEMRSVYQTAPGSW
jgi:phenylacetate-CoA oxygenase PaaI subunit